jgi:hypothetical protein
LAAEALREAVRVATAPVARGLAARAAVARAPEALAVAVRVRVGPMRESVALAAVLVGARAAWVAEPWAARAQAVPRAEARARLTPPP